MDKKRDALDRLLELTVLLGADMARGLAEAGLTVSRAHLLWELRQRGPSTQKALADAMGVTPRTVTGLVDALESSGFVTREPHPTDRRATLVTFTQHGARTADELERGHRELARQLFARMRGADLDAFLGVLDEVVARLREFVSAEQARE